MVDKAIISRFYFYGKLHSEQKSKLFGLVADFTFVNYVYSPVFMANCVDPTYGSGIIPVLSPKFTHSKQKAPTQRPEQELDDVRKTQQYCCVSCLIQSMFCLGQTVLSVCRFSHWINHSENQSEICVWCLQADLHQQNKGLNSSSPFTAWLNGTVLRLPTETRHHNEASIW